MQIEEKILKHIMNTIHAAVRVFHMNGELLAYYGDNQKNDVVLQDKELWEALVEQTKEEYPYIYQDFYPVYFMAIRKRDRIYILGAVNSDYTVEKVEGLSVGDYFARKHHIHMEGRDSRGKCRLSFCEMQTFAEEGLLLFNILNDTNLICAQLMERNYIGDVNAFVKKELNQVYFRYQENEKLHNPYDQEVRELNSIREGNVENLIKAIDEVVEGEYATLSREPLRSMKNLSIVSLALVCRAAIDGGMMPEEAFSLNDSYILKVDAATSIIQLRAINRKAKLEYVNLVHLVHEKIMMKQKNRLVEEAKNLIFQQMHDKIVVQDIAKKLSVTPEYLSALFKKIEGISISNYIYRKKVGIAENLLKYSEYSIEEISYYLGFCSQSHFGKHFKEINQITPQKFREKYGVRDFIKGI